MSRLVLVRHGPGRGRGYPYFAPYFDYLVRHDPDLFERIQLHETGTEPPSLAAAKAVVFWLADPLAPLYPECFEEAQALAHEAKRRGLPVINPPTALSASTKSKQSRIWREHGLPAPQLWHFKSREQLDSLIPELRFPLVLRPDGLHSQIGVRLCHSASDITGGPLHYPGTLTEFVDVRATYRQSAPQSIYARYYHKKRAMIFGDTVLNNHVFFGPHPIVGRQTCTFWDFERAPWTDPIRKLQTFLDCRPCLQEERRFWLDPPQHAGELRRAAQVLGCTYNTIDYSTRADGSLVLWEANPYVSLERWDKALLPRLRRTRRRIHGFYEKIGDFFRQLLREPADEQP